MSAVAVAPLLCWCCGRDGGVREHVVADAERYAKRAVTPRQAVGYFKGYLQRHPYLQRCEKCHTTTCTREGCKCRC